MVHRSDELGSGQLEADPDEMLPGAVFMVPNSHWGFSGVTSDDHPGACAHYHAASREGVLVGGTDADHARSRNYFFVEPTLENGLRKLTAFRLVPRYFRLHRLKLYFPERFLGRLETATLQALQEALALTFPEN